MQICMVVLTAVSLFSSFAASSISPTTSPMSIPESSYNSGVLKMAIVYYHDTEPHYRVNCLTVNGGSNYRFSETTFLFSDSTFSYTSDIFDVNTGNLINSSSGSAQFNSYQNRYQRYFQSSDEHVSGLYFIVPSEVTVTYTAKVVEPFVTWSLQPQEHNTYHSELSEPVADEYNSYFICNDRLYWLSYRANGLYSFTSNFELNSQLYSESVSMQSSGQGTYVGQQNGYTEQVTGFTPYFTGSTGDGTIVTGTLTPPDFGQIDFVGVNQGQLRVNSNGQMTYNDLEVYPVSVTSQFLNRLFDIIVYLTDDAGFKIWLVPRSDLGQNLVLDASLYCSCFDLTNGDYISSSFSSYTGNYQYAGFDYPLEDNIASVRCYGCAFYNVNNIPVNLSDVFWQYDLEFKEWRDNMLQKLTQIYNLLNNSDSIPETTTSSFGSSVEGLSDPSYSEVTPEQVGNELNNAWDQNPDIVTNSGFVKGWISEFSIPKIIALCILALASGTVILTLGKNKADT